MKWWQQFANAPQTRHLVPEGVYLAWSSLSAFVRSLVRLGNLIFLLNKAFEGLVLRRISYNTITSNAV